MVSGSLSIILIKTKFNLSEIYSMTGTQPRDQCQWQNKICHIGIPILYIELYPFSYCMEVSQSTYSLLWPVTKL